MVRRENGREERVRKEEREREGEKGMILRDEERKGGSERE